MWVHHVTTWRAVHHLVILTTLLLHLLLLHLLVHHEVVLGVHTLWWTSHALGWTKLVRDHAIAVAATSLWHWGWTVHLVVLLL